MMGPGVYDSACTLARLSTGGSVVLIVLNGKLGSGFSAQFTDGEHVAKLPEILRNVAEQMAADKPNPHN